MYRLAVVVKYCVTKSYFLHERGSLREIEERINKKNKKKKPVVLRRIATRELGQISKRTTTLLVQATEIKRRIIHKGPMYLVIVGKIKGFKNH